MEEVEGLYSSVIKHTGGEHGYLSKGNLGYLLETVKDVGERAPTRQAIVKKAAFLLYNVLVIHPFINGNKRTGYELARLFLRANGFELSAETKVSYRFLLDIASGKVSETDVEAWVGSHLSDLEEK